MLSNTANAPKVSNAADNTIVSFVAQATHASGTIAWLFD